MANEIRHCCKIGCTNKAAYEIWYGYAPKADDYTDACLLHVGDLFDDSPRFEVIAIPETTDGK